MFHVDNAVIMAAGMSSRFVPLSYEKPKALLEVKGEIMIERQIRQLREAGISEIIVVTGYKAEMFEYLKNECGVVLVNNPEYLFRNNHSSIFAVRNFLKNTYICSADNYFTENPFEQYVADSYYAALYAQGPTKEWCMVCDDSGRIKKVQIGGEDSWYMLGHAFWSEEFSTTFKSILEGLYDLPETVGLFWEDIYIKYIDELEMKIRKYDPHVIYEFDTLDELREFDTSYVNCSRSEILKKIALQLHCEEKNISCIVPLKNTQGEVYGFQFRMMNRDYYYEYSKGIAREVNSL